MSGFYDLFFGGRPLFLGAVSSFLAFLTLGILGIFFGIFNPYSVSKVFFGALGFLYLGAGFTLCCGFNNSVLLLLLSSNPSNFFKKFNIYILHLDFIYR